MKYEDTYIKIRRVLKRAKNLINLAKSEMTKMR